MKAHKTNEQKWHLIVIESSPKRRGGGAKD